MEKSHFTWTNFWGAGQPCCLDYERHWPKPPDALHYGPVKLNTKIADSLILATASMCLCLSGFLLRYTSHSDWLVAVCWVLLPPLLVPTLFFWGRDMAKPKTRKQAILAFALIVPLLALEVWFFKNLKV